MKICKSTTLICCALLLTTAVSSCARHHSPSSSAPASSYARHHSPSLSAPVSSYAYNYHPSSPAPASKSPESLKAPRWIKFVLPHFDVIDVAGDIHLQIIAGQSKQTVTAPSLSHVNIWVHNHTLMLRPRHFYFYSSRKRPSISVKIYTQNLTGLKLPEFTTITGRNILGSHQTTVNITSDRNHAHTSVSLRGVFSPRKITKKGVGHLDIRWIRGQKLEVVANRGNIRLAGTVDHLLTKLSGTASLDSKHLRAQHVWIRSKNASRAEIMALQSLNIFASNHSLIDYYKYPPYLMEHLQGSANVIHQQEWN